MKLLPRPEAMALLPRHHLLLPHHRLPRDKVLLCDVKFISSPWSSVPDICFFRFRLSISPDRRRWLFFLVIIFFFLIIGSQDLPETRYCYSTSDSSHFSPKLFSSPFLRSYLFNSDLTLVFVAADYQSRQTGYDGSSSSSSAVATPKKQGTIIRRHNSSHLTCWVWPIFTSEVSLQTFVLSSCSIPFTCYCF
jgi:hypothetical protein